MLCCTHCQALFFDALHIGDSVNEIYRDVLNLDEKEAQPVLEQLAVILETNELPELAQALKQQK